MRLGPRAHTTLTALLLVLSRACYAGSMFGVPENITVTFLSPKSVRVSWSTNSDLIEKYDVTYKPTEARVVLVVAGNSEAVTLSGLEPDTQYQVTVAAVAAGHKYRSRPIVFRTLEPTTQGSTKSEVDDDFGSGFGDVITGVGDTPQNLSPTIIDANPTFPTIRGVEVGIVVFVLIFWVGAIALFFNRWGKIRMLLPYQPDYKQEQLKVPGTGVCAATGATTCGGHSTQTACSHMHWTSNNGHTHSFECEELLAHSRPHSRPRVNSAIFMSAEPQGFAGFEPGDFLRRYGSQSKLCRKARSADDIPLSTMRHNDSIERPGTIKIPREEIIKEQEEGSRSELSESESVVTVKHFGLPILSVSGPSPPDEDFDKIDEYL